MASVVSVGAETDGDRRDDQVVEDVLYSFDDDFDTIQGITRLETPDNPFN